MSDLKTSYLGFTLVNPVVASASPLSESVPRIRQLEDAGVSAVVLPSLFEEQLSRRTGARLRPVARLGKLSGIAQLFSGYDRL